jgi:hypothetical protein
LFESRVLRKIIGPKTDKVTGEWRKLHNEELHDLHSSPSIIRIMKSRRRWACSTNGGEEECVRVVGGKSRGKEATRETKR